MRIDVEWLEAPGVLDTVDAQCWARLVVSVDDGAEVLTRAYSWDTGQARDGVYGSVFPLARWLVDHYWFAIEEGPKAPRFDSGRRLGAVTGLRDWVQRHNLLAARDGFALPDLSIVRDGQHVLLICHPDPAKVKNSPVRFLSQSRVGVPPADFKAAVSRFVSTVIERTRGLDHPDVAALRDDWAAIVGADTQEAKLCSWMARVGLDPYSSDDATDEVVSFFEESLAALSPGVRGDLLDAAGEVEGLRSGLSWLGQVGKLASQGVASGRASKARAAIAFAHESGYRRAREVRRELGLSSTGDQMVSAAALREYGWGLSSCQAGPEQPRFVDGLVGAPRRGAPTIVGVPLAHEDQVFRWARALFLWRFDLVAGGPRMLSRAHSREQRESRAFAAELLAPADAIRKRLSGAVLGDAEIGALANGFQVRRRVIEHQVENHGLAILE